MRERVSNESLLEAIDTLKRSLAKEIDRKGQNSFASTHEVLGVITEEYQELIDAVKSNNIDDVLLELTDLAVGCLFGIACYINLGYKVKEK